MSEQQAEEISEALEEPTPKKRSSPKKKAAPAANLGLSPQTIRARAIVLGRLKP